MEEKKLLPQEINEIFSKLQSEIIWLYGRWIIFEQLYGKSPERVELLNESAATYFRVTQDVLLSDILIHIGRITDKPKIQGNENLSLEQIIARLDKNKYSDLVKTLEEKMENIRILSRGIRQYRNKRLANQDIRIALKKAEIMPEVTFGSIRSTLESICDFMNGCELYFCDNEMAYEAFAMRADGKALITRLKKAITYDELEKDGVIERGYWRRKSRFRDA